MYDHYKCAVLFPSFASVVSAQCSLELSNVCNFVGTNINRQLSLEQKYAV